MSIVPKITNALLEEQGYTVLGDGGFKADTLDCDDTITKDGHVIYTPEMGFGGLHDVYYSLSDGNGSGTVDYSDRHISVENYNYSTWILDAKQEIKACKQAVKQIETSENLDNDKTDSVMDVINFMVEAGHEKPIAKIAQKLISKIHASDAEPRAKHFLLVELGRTTATMGDQSVSLLAFTESMAYLDTNSPDGFNYQFFVRNSVDGSGLSSDAKQEVYEGLVSVVLSNDSVKAQVEGLAEIGRCMPYRITEGMREFRMASDIIKAEQDNIESTMTLHDIFALKENLYFSMSCAGRDFRVRAQVGFENIYHEIRELPFGGDRLIYTYQLARNIGISDLELETTKSLFHWMYTDAKNDFSEFKDAVDYATIRDVKFQLRNLENTLHYALVTEGHMTEQEFVEEFGIGLL